MTDPLKTRVGTILKGTASGLIPMAIFTPIYAVWPILAWPVIGSIFFLMACAWSVFLVVFAVRMLRLGNELPHETNEFDDRVTKGMSLVGGLQGGLILLAVIVMAFVGQWYWLLPTIALVVALHFFALPIIFRRTIDYYLGTAMLLVAATGLIMVAGDPGQWRIAWAVVGFGGAIVTSCYGLWMVLTARRTLADYAVLVAKPN